jgi:hypothetical protein
MIDRRSPFHIALTGVTTPDHNDFLRTPAGIYAYFARQPYFSCKMSPCLFNQRFQLY